MGLAFIISMVHRRIPTQLLLLKKSSDIGILLGSLSDFISFLAPNTPLVYLKIVLDCSLKKTYNPAEQILAILLLG